MLVPAMFRPEQRKHRQLEVVRATLERPLDLRVLGVRQPEGTMERLLGRLCHAFKGCYRTLPARPAVGTVSARCVTDTSPALLPRWLSG